MRKNKKGRPPKGLLLTKQILDLRNMDLSYTEIAEHLGIKSRQLARYYATRKLSTAVE